MAYHVVLKLAKRVTAPQRALAQLYQLVLNSSRFSVLFYGSQQERIQQARRDLHVEGTPQIRLCPYSFGEVRRHFPAMEARLQNSSTWAYGKVDMRQTAFTPRGVTGPELILFWRGLLSGCDGGTWSFVWTVESDAAFLGVTSKPSLTVLVCPFLKSAVVTPQGPMSYILLHAHAHEL